MIKACSLDRQYNALIVRVGGKFSLADFAVLQDICAAVAPLQDPAIPVFDLSEVEAIDIEIDTLAGHDSAPGKGHPATPLSGARCIYVAPTSDLVEWCKSADGWQRSGGAAPADIVATIDEALGVLAIDTLCRAFRLNKRPSSEFQSV